MIESLVERHFGIHGAACEPLRGYETSNFLVRDDDDTFVLKVCDDEPGLSLHLESESEVLRFLETVFPGRFPFPVADVRGNFVTEAVTKEGAKLLRLLTYIDGDVAGRSGLTGDLLEPLGRMLAEIAVAMREVRIPGIEARKLDWDLQYYYLNRRYLEQIHDPSDRKYVEYFFRKADEFVRPELETLERGIIHGDANEWNIVIGNDGLSLIDFADTCHSPLINDLAVACCYAAMFSDDPVAGLAPLIAGYSSVRPLSEKECSLLFDLIGLRLCASVCHSANAKQIMPENEYALVSEKRAWSTLKRWVALNPVRCENEFRRAAGFPGKDVGDGAGELEVRRRTASSALSLQFSEPIRMRSAAFQYMFDAEGRSYLDCYNNIPHVGHCHPKVAEAIAKASIKLNTNTRYLTEEFNSYVTRLLEKFPAKLSKVFLVNSGSAATDLALRLAEAHTGSRTAVVAEHGYHGNTRSGIAVSHYKYAGKGGPGRPGSVIEAPMPDIFVERGREDLFEMLRSRVADAGDRPAAFIAEPIVGCGGQVPLPEGYLREVYPYIRSLGGVCISDEVQTGFGRLGKWFWGFEMHGVIPDIVILGKPIGNGHPMAAVVTTEEISASFETGMEFFSSFGGNTVSCAAGNAVLDVIETEALQENAEIVGGHLLAGLTELTNRFGCCADARGAGLFLGLEISDEGRTTADTGLASRVKNRLRERGILVGTDGPHDNVIKIKPPICFTLENAYELLAALEAAIPEG